MKFNRRKFSNCKDCPLNGEIKVSGEGPADPKIIIVGEAPGTMESREGKPFVGPAGKWLNAALGEAGIFRHRCWTTNVISCQPPKNRIDSWEATEAIKCCRPGFLKELENVSKSAKVWVPLGSTAKTAFGVSDSITKSRGSVYDGRKLPINVVGPVVPTYHPSYIMRGQLKEEPTWVADFEKIKKISKSGWKPPKEDFILYPSAQETLAFLSECTKKRSVLAVDIETTGLNPLYAKIICIGIAVDGERAISIPFLYNKAEQFFTAKEYTRVFSALRRAFKVCPTIFQNALFDVRHLQYHGIEVGNIVEDVLLAHHAYHPELPHNLGYIVSIYGTTPYWKSEVLGRDWKLDNLDKDFFVYNLRDSVVLHQVLPELLSDLKEAGTEDTYRKYSLPLIAPVMEMIDTGLPIDRKKLKTWTSSLRRKFSKIETELNELLHLPDGFNIGSDIDLRLLLYGEVHNKFVRAKKEKDEIDSAMAEAKLKHKKEPKTKKPKDRTTTKKYAELERVCRVANTKVLYQPKHTIKRTESGMSSVNEESLENIIKAANNRRAEIASLKRRTGKHELEEKQIEKLVKAVGLLLRYREVSKLLSTYSSYPIGPDGRVHGRYVIHGTATGRLASREPNCQNIPKEARSVFIAPEGKTIISADYSNLELRVLAFVSEDIPLQETFAAGINVHDANTRDLFGIEPDDPSWSQARRASKIYIFGRNYGGGLRGIFQRVTNEVPEMGLTFSRFTSVDKRYRSKHPAYAKWAENVEATVKATRRISNAFGRVRLLLGPDHAIVKEGLNYGIQSTAADIINKATIGVHNELRRNKHPAKLIGQVHDSLMIETPEETVDEVIAIMRKHMEAKYKINGKVVSFPVDFEVGQSWGEMNAWNGATEAGTV
jgi:uracil-DNA glycosylase family 4